MSEQWRTWVHRQKQQSDPTRFVARMEPALAEAVDELDRCTECGCCVAACGTARLRGNDDFEELVVGDDGVFACMKLLGCHDICPEQLPLQTQIAFLRRKTVAQGWS